MDGLNQSVAHELISKGNKLVYVRHLSGTAFISRSPYDPMFSEKCRVIPSWQSVYKPDPSRLNPKGIFQGFRIHYLDLPILEALSASNGYRLEYEDREALRRLKREYTDRRDWKAKAFVEVPAKRPLDPLQTVGSGFLFRAGGALLADGVGGGKTAEAIGAVILNKLDGRPHKTLVVCPTTLKGAWKGEANDITDDLKVMILDKQMERRFEQYPLVEDMDMLICSFGTFISDYEEIAKYFNPAILIVDEAHRLCNKDNTITQILIGGKTVKKTFMSIAKPHSVYLITGTPIGNELEDLYPILKALDPNILHWNGFRSRYTILKEGARWEHKIDPATGKVVKGKRKFYTVEGYKNEAELKGKLALHMIRRTKDVLLPNLPPKTYETVEIDLDAEERAIYDDLKIKWQAFIRGKEVNVGSHLSWLTRAQQVTNSLETYPGSGGIKKSSKLKKLLEIVDANAAHRKIIIFSKFEAMTSIIERELRAWHPLHLNGDTPDEDRYEMWHEKFQKDPKYRVFISTIATGGAGITLTASDLCILYDRDWTLKNNEQAADRIHRRGQTKPCKIIALRVRDTIDEHIERTWIGKGMLVDSTIGVDKAVRDMMLEEKEKLI